MMKTILFKRFNYLLLLIIHFFLLTWFPLTVYSKIYKYQDNQGQWHYTSKPPQEALESKEILIKKTVPVSSSTKLTAAEQSKIKDFMSDFNCKLVLLNDTQSQIVLEGKLYVWVLVNMGSASAVIRTKSDPIFSKVIKPQTGTSIEMFTGDTRNIYTLGLTQPDTETNVHVCTVPPNLKPAELNLKKGYKSRLIQQNKKVPILLWEDTYNRGLALSNKGKYDKAILEFTKAIQINSKDARVYLHRGLAYEKTGQDDEAFSDFTETLKINPENVDAYYNRGIISARKGQYDQAIVDYTKVIEINPRHSWSYGNRGGIYFKQGQIDQAISDFTKAVSIDPDFAGDYYNRGLAYDEKDQYDQAISDYTKVININPRDAAAYYARGHDYLKIGSYDNAISDYTKVIEIGTDYSAKAYFLRGLSYSLIGQNNIALDDYYKAQKMGFQVPSSFLEDLIKK